MDILNPDLQWIEDRCYRLLSVHDGEKGEIEHDIPRSIPIQEDEDDYYDSDLAITHKGNQFYISILAPAHLIKHVIGKQFKKAKEIELQTGAKIKFPRDRKTTVELTISGQTKKAVIDAYRKIEYIITDQRLKTDSTHFVSLPVNHPEIIESFLKFKKEVLAKYGRVRGVNESIFQNPNKLHVTIALLVLLDEVDNQNAIAILKKCTDDILKQLGDRQFIVKVKGIEYMNDDPAEVDILYAKLSEPGNDTCLQIIADSISKGFLNAKLSKFQYDKVKLHVTIMNTIFRDKLEEQDNYSDRTTFDATGILKDFGEYEFGEIRVSELHISIRYSTSSDGYYNAIHKLKL